MSAAPLRIVRSRIVKTSTSTGGNAAYLDRLVKLIPSEVVALYLAGMKLIPTSDQVVALVWLLLCVLLVLLVRALGTRDAPSNLGPQWTAVAISEGAFLIWAFSLGGIFATFSWYQHFSYVGSLLILGYTTIVPYIYRGS
jgi:hypothetical protein